MFHDDEGGGVCVKNDVLQGNRRKRRKSEGVVLRNMSYRPTFDQG